MDLQAHLKTMPMHRKITAGGGAAMIVALTLPWVSLFGVSFNGWRSWGILAGLAAIGLVVLEGVRASGNELELPVPIEQVNGGLAAASALGGLILFFQVAGARGIGAFLGLLVVLGLAYGAFLSFTAPAEVDAAPEA